MVFTKNPFKQAPMPHGSFISKGDAGYDNPRENIDPHIKTKVLDTKELVYNGAEISLTYVPYISATADLNLGTYNLFAQNVSAKTLTLTTATNGVDLFNHLTSGFDTIILNGKTAGAGTSIRIHSKDGDGTDYNQLQIFGVGAYNSLGNLPTNYERITLMNYAARNEYGLFTEAGGTGTIRPLDIFTGTNYNQIYLGTNGRVGILNNAPATELDVNGDITGSGALFVTDVYASLYLEAQDGLFETLTFTTSDPELMTYYPTTRERALFLLEKSIPLEKWGGVSYYFNKDTNQMEAIDHKTGNILKPHFEIIGNIGKIPEANGTIRKKN